MQVGINTVRLSMHALWMLGLLGLGQLGCAPAEVDNPLPQSPADRSDPSHARLQRVLSRAPENLRLHALKDGTQYVEVVSGFQHATVVTISDAGVKTSCVTNADDAVRLLDGRPQ